MAKTASAVETVATVADAVAGSAVVEHVVSSPEAGEPAVATFPVAQATHAFDETYSLTAQRVAVQHVAASVETVVASAALAAVPAVQVKVAQVAAATAVTAHASSTAVTASWAVTASEAAV